MKKVPLDKLVKVIGGYAFKSDDFESEGHPIIRISNINGESIDLENVARIPSGKIGKGSTYSLKGGDILIAMSGATTGKIGVVPGNIDEQLYLNQRVGKYEILDAKNLCSRYLLAYLRSEHYQKHVWSIAWGAAQPNISGTQLVSAEIPLPPLEEQKRIAAILDQADALRKARRRAIARLNDLSQSIFYEMFGDAITNNKCWPIASLEQFGSIDRGVSKHRPRNAPDLLGGIYPLIQTGDVSNSVDFIRNYNSTYSETGLKQSKMWPKGTLCITIAANIANTAILDFEACFPDSVVGFIGRNEAVTLFIHFWFKQVRSSIEAVAPAVAQKNINLKTLRELAVISPPKLLIEKFALQIKNIVQIRPAFENHSSKLDTLFSSLQQRAFRGKLGETSTAELSYN